MRLSHAQASVEEQKAKMDEMERQIAEVLRLRSHVRKSKTAAARAALEQGPPKKGKPPPPTPSPTDPSRVKAAREKRMGDLLRMCNTILRQMMQHKWSWPFLKPVDAAALNLLDYHTIISKPMDLGSIKERLDGKDPTFQYTHPQQVCDDVHLVFRNALGYNLPGTDVYVMADTLAQRWEDRWQQQIVQKMKEEEKKRALEDEEAGGGVGGGGVGEGGEGGEVGDGLGAEEGQAEALAQQITLKLAEMDVVLADLNQKIGAKCRPMSVEEKRELGAHLGLLPAENLGQVISIIHEGGQQTVNRTATEVEIDIDRQEPVTLWKLRRYVSSIILPKRKGAGSGAGGGGGAGLKGGGKQSHKRLKGGEGLQISPLIPVQ